MNELRTKLVKELNKIQELVGKIEPLLDLIETLKEPVYLDGLISGLALYLENFYMGVERVFSLIAKEIDGVMPNDKSWHIQLLKQMSVELPSIRPAVISQETYEKLNEFRGFRHVVRNLYAYDLEPHRIIDLGKKVNKCYQSFRNDLVNFDDFLSNQ